MRRNMVAAPRLERGFRGKRIAARVWIAWKRSQRRRVWPFQRRIQLVEFRGKLLGLLFRDNDLPSAFQRECMSYVHLPVSTTPPLVCQSKTLIAAKWLDVTAAITLETGLFFHCLRFCLIFSKRRSETSLSIFAMMLGLFFAAHTHHQ